MSFSLFLTHFLVRDSVEGSETRKVDTDDYRLDECSAIELTPA